MADMSPLRFALILAVPCLAVAGCQSSETDGFTPGTGAVPPVLQEMEHQATQGFDLALAGDFPGVAAAASHLDTDWKTYRSHVPQNEAGRQVVTMMNENIDSLVEEAGTSTDRIRLARNVNRISGIIADLYRPYAPPVPPAVRILDHLGRELLLDGMTADYDGARDHLVLFRDQWDLLRDTVLDAGATEVESRFDRDSEVLARAVQEQDAARIQNAARLCLDRVDEVEHVF